MSDRTVTVMLPSDDPPTFSDEPHTHLFVRADWDYHIAVGPHDGRHPLHWVTLRTCGGYDHYALLLLAGLHAHLRGDSERARVREAGQRVQRDRLRSRRRVQGQAPR